MLSQPDVNPPPTVINDPQSKAIAYPSHKDVVIWGRFFVVVFLFLKIKLWIAFASADTLSCLPSVPLRMELLRGWKQAASFV